jgi:hypothetical protein
MRKITQRLFWLAMSLTLVGCIMPQPQVLPQVVEPQGEPIRCAAQIVDDSLMIDCDLRTPTPTRIEATSTPTRIEATSTPTIALPTGTPIAIARADWPLCLEHDPTQWHALDDAIRQCHYTHSHGDNPNRPDVVEVFGTYKNGITYPWATTRENEIKHEGYFILAYGRGQIPISPHLNWLGGTTANFVNAARIHMHFMPNHMDAAVRNHSYYMEIETCEVANPSNCGIIRTGGHWSTGLLHCTYKDRYCALPGDIVHKNYWIPGTDTSGKTIDPYRGHLQNCPQLLQKLAAYWPAWDPGSLFKSEDTNNENTTFWTSAPTINGVNPFGTNKIGGFGVANFDNVVCTDPDLALTYGISGTKEFADHLFYRVCDSAPASKKELCRFDGTEFSLINAWTFTPNLPDGNYFTDLTGAVSKVCTEATFECVPLFIESDPPRGWTGYNFSETKWPNGKIPGTIRDFNTSPLGKQWVTAYNAVR